MHMLVAHAQWPVIEEVLQAVQAKKGEHWTVELLNTQDKDFAGVIDRAFWVLAPSLPIRSKTLLAASSSAHRWRHRRSMSGIG